MKSAKLTVSMSVSMFGGSNNRVTDSINTKKAMTIRNRPLMNPDRISTRPNLENNFSQSGSSRRRAAVMKETPPVGEDPSGFPASHEGGEQTQDQSGAVEQHVEAVRDEPQAVGPDAIKQLHEGEGLKADPVSQKLEEVNSVSPDKRTRTRFRHRK